MNRFNLLGAITLVLIVANVTRAADKQPNIVFFFTDDQTSSTLGCYGNPIVKTPNINALAERGTRFRYAFVSHSICWVSRTTILTGLYGRSYGTPGNPDLTRADVARELYSDILRDNGYRTGYFGKWHAKMPRGYRNSAHFDEFEAIGRKPYYKPQKDGTLRHETELIVDRGIKFIKNQPKDKPFALNMWFNACHAEDGDRRPGIGHFPWPREIDGEYQDRHIDEPRLSDPKIFENQPEFLKTTINRERFFWRWNTPQKYQTNMRAYYRMVSGIDGAIGRFMKVLEDLGLAENTIIVYTADNGYHMGNRGFAGKWSHYEESLRVPMIICDPRVPKDQQGQVTDAMALNVDLPATFLDWAGVEIPDRYQGRSLQPIVNEGQPDDWRTETFHEHFAVRSRIPAFEGLRNENFKYVRYFDHDNYEFLHDLKNDPDELVNLAKDPKHEETLKAMRERTDKKVAELGGALDPLKGRFTLSTEPHPKASAAVTVKPGRDGFTNLLGRNGLRGWFGDSRVWSIKNGVLTGKTDDMLKQHRSVTWTGSTVRNFELRVQVKMTGNADSGIQYRGKSRPDLALDSVTGYQCDVISTEAEYNGMLFEQQGRNLIAHAGERVIVDEDGDAWVVGKLPLNKFSAIGWHFYRIVVKGNHHQHWIDGRLRTEVIDFDEEHRKLEGVLALQVLAGSDTVVQFRDLKIKHLPDDLPLLKAEDHPIPPNAYGVKPYDAPDGWNPPLYRNKAQ
ncbi:MAG: acetylglucosamine-6-sulfatase [Planctomycetaceae bacterium]|nr:acetylglucosamine-6-sulfatase [Planctomycetaceae bacterium]